MSIYDSGIVKLAKLVFSDMNETEYDNTESFNIHWLKAEEVITDEKIRDFVDMYVFEASEQFFILGFLKAMEIFNIETGKEKSPLRY